MSQEETKKRRVLTLRERSCLAIFACLQNALVGGLVFGWASIDRTMLVASHEKGGAGLSTMETTTIFSWASSIAMLSSLVMGLVLDRFGPRTSSVLCNILTGIGCQLFATATTFPVFAVATCMIAFGGPGISSSIVHIANLFPQNQFLVMSCLCGSITFSFSILAVFGDLWEHYHLGFRTLFGGYVIVIAASTLGSFCLWPDQPFEKEDSDAYYDDNNTEFNDHEEQVPLVVSAEKEYVEATLCHHQLLEEPLNSGLRRKLTYGRTESYFHSVEAMEGGLEPAEISLKDQPFWNQILSQTYLRNLLIFITNSFFVNFTIASISTEMADQQVFSVEVQHDLARSFTLIMSGGVVASLLVGWLMDRAGLEFCTIVTLALGQMSLVLRIVGHSYPAMLLGYIFYTLFRQFLFPVFIACLTARLGFKYFGLLSGTAFALSGIAQIFMASLVHWLSGDCHSQPETIYGSVPCNHGSWNAFHILQISMLAILTLLPILDRREAARPQETSVQTMQGTTSKLARPDVPASSAPASPSGTMGQAVVAAYGSTEESSVV